MKEKFLKVAQSCHFFAHHKRVLVAVSTGQDSMALLECLLETRERLKIEIGIAHVNHKQRQESEEEEAFLQAFSDQHALPFYATAFQDSVFSEQKARDFRYDFFESIMREHDYSALVTAHHQDDQAETILMRLIRGNRLKDLAGIQAVRPFGPGELIRPLLSFQKTELTPSIYFEDSSNQEPSYFRNRVRQMHLPYLQTENPLISDHLVTLGDEIKRLYSALQSLTKDIDPTNLAIFLEQTKEVQFVLLQQYIETIPNLQVSPYQIHQLVTILNTKANYYDYLKDGYYFKKDYTSFSITKIGPKTDVSDDEIVIESDNIFDFGQVTFSLNKEIDHDQIIYLRPSKKTIIRYRKKGDYLVVNGIRKKLRRYYIDHKIPLTDRQNALIVEQSGEIMGIANIVASDLSKSLKNDIIKDTLYIKMKEKES